MVLRVLLASAITGWVGAMVWAIATGRYSVAACLLWVLVDLLGASIVLIALVGPWRWAIEGGW